MSRIGKAPIEIPSGVEVAVETGMVRAKGPKGEFGIRISDELSVTREDNTLTVGRPTENRRHRALHGLTRTLIFNLVTGVSKGFSRELEIEGVGYRAAKKNNGIELQLGFSHPVQVEPPAGVSIEVPAPNRIVVSGIDKQQVGELAAKIRAIRPPEPYKGKGVRFAGEHVRRKVGKTGK